MEGEVKVGDNLHLVKGTRVMKLRPQVTVVKADIGEMGGSAKKSQFEARLAHHETKLHLVAKKATIFDNSDLFGDENKQMNSAWRYYERWKYLKSIGIPTAHSMRVADKDTIAMGDMTADGSEFFAKEKMIKLEGEIHKGIKRELSKMEKVFSALPFDQIKEEMKRIAEIAKKNQIRLPLDDLCDLLVHPDGTWEVLVLDLSGMSRFQVKEYDVKTEAEMMFGAVEAVRYLLGEVTGKK